MQHMHDNAINERTKLRLDAETEEHRQRTLDLQLIKNEERSAKEGELERRAAEHRLFLERQGQAERLKREEIEETHRFVSVHQSREPSCNTYPSRKQTCAFLQFLPA